MIFGLYKNITEKNKFLLVYQRFDCLYNDNNGKAELKTIYAKSSCGSDTLSMPRPLLTV